MHKNDCNGASTFGSEPVKLDWLRLPQGKILIITTISMTQQVLPHTFPHSRFGVVWNSKVSTTDIISIIINNNNSHIPTQYYKTRNDLHYECNWKKNSKRISIAHQVECPSAQSRRVAQYDAFCHSYNNRVENNEMVCNVLNLKNDEVQIKTKAASRW